MLEAAIYGSFDNLGSKNRSFIEDPKPDIQSNSVKLL